MRISLVIISILLISCSMFSQKTIEERLGHPKGTKLLIMHADDIGVSHSVNAATIEALEKGGINSASIMVPCPWFYEIANYIKENPQYDFGLHLTVTAEWQNYKWGGVLPASEIPSLLNEEGFFYDNTADVVKYGRPEEVEAELRAQVKRAIDFGIKPTHLDSHMRALFNSPEFFAIYQKIGKEFGIPVMIGGDNLTNVDPYFIPLTKLYSADPSVKVENWNSFYTNIIKNLQPGLNEIIVHVAYDDAESQAVMINHPDFGPEWRQRDLDYVLSEEFRNALKENNVKLVTYREVQKLLKK